jgi:uncharacterized protein DUF4262
MTKPDARAFYDGIAANIAKAGRSLIAVGGSKLDPSFCYSIGNSLVGKPELIVFGLAPEDAMYVLNAASERPEIVGLETGGLVQIGGTFGLKAVRCGALAKATYSIQATRFLRDDAYDLVQLLVPDPAGRYPGDPDCALPYANAPILNG